MNSTDIARDYVEAWNTHDTDRFRELFTEDGAYTDPNVSDGVPVRGLAQYAAGLISAFPDLFFEETRVLRAGDDVVITEWIMKGTNTGSLRGLPPTGKSIALPGIDVIECEGDRIRSVTGQFNVGTMLEQLDVQVVVQPKSVGPVSFGSSTYTSVGSKKKPGAIGVTQLQLASPDDCDELRTHTREVLQEISRMPGFISSSTSLSWDGHGVTLTAWEDMESAKKAVQGEAHRKAVEAFFATSGLAESAWTCLLTDGQMNTRWQRCGECGNMAAVTTALECKCGGSLTEPAWL